MWHGGSLPHRPFQDMIELDPSRRAQITVWDRDHFLSCQSCTGGGRISKAV
jgi:hypothetical protein